MKNKGKNWVHYVGLGFAVVVIAAIIIGSILAYIGV